MDIYSVHTHVGENVYVQFIMYHDIIVSIFLLVETVVDDKRMALVNVTVCNMSVIRIVSVKVIVFPHTRPFHGFHVPLYVPMYQSIVMVSVSVAVTSPISGLSLYLVLVTATKLSTCTSISFDVQAMYKPWGSFICMGTQKEVNNNVQQAFKVTYHFKYFTPPWVASDCSCLNF